MGYQYSVRTQSLDEKFNKMLVVERLSSGLSAAFGCAALLLASLGLYGLISYIVQMRHLEIGIRIALGATRGGVLSHILSEALAVVAIGVLIGAPLAWLTSHALASKYVNLGQGIFMGIGSASFILVTTALLAAFLPARRASTVEPATALRSE
jgi:macrolide transport system ATP-binding/permease protein